MVLPGITSPLLAAGAMPALSAMQEPIPADIVYSNWINPYSLTSQKIRPKRSIQVDFTLEPFIFEQFFLEYLILDHFILYQLILNHFILDSFISDPLILDHFILNTSLLNTLFEHFIV